MAVSQPSPPRRQVSKRPVPKRPMPTAVPQRLTFATSLGWMGLLYDEVFLRRLRFGYSTQAQLEQAMASEGLRVKNRDREMGRGRKMGREHSSHKPPAWVNDLRDQLCSYAAGESQDFGQIPLATHHLTPFAQQVTLACRQIPWGQIVSYGQLAQRVGRPGAARAVGTVMATNCVPLIVPCHRVVGATGKLGGYSAAGGLDTKRQLLKAEGCPY